VPDGPDRLDPGVRGVDVPTPTLALISRQRLLADTLAAQLVASGCCGVEVLDADHPDLLAACRAVDPALLVLDVADQVVPGLSLLSNLVAAFPGAGVLLVGEISADEVAEAISRGAKGCLTYSAALDEVRAAILAILAGQTVVPTEELTRIIEGLHHAEQAPSRPAYGLSEREIEVLRRLAAGQSTDDMAAAMGISVPTVRKHVQNVLGKLGVHSKLQAAALAVRRGIV